MDRRHPARLIRHAAHRTCRRSMRTATPALGTTMSRPSSLTGSHRVSLPISSQGAAKDCAFSLTWSGRAAENAGLLKRQHRSRSQRRFPEDALVANVGCRRLSSVAMGSRRWSLNRTDTGPSCRRVGNRSSCPISDFESAGRLEVEAGIGLVLSLGRSLAILLSKPPANNPAKGRST
jgi:hypothetical protein